MSLPIVVAFAFEPILSALVWAVLLVLNLWIFQKSKAKGNLLMLVGAAILSLVYLLWAFEAVTSSFVGFWLPFFGAICIVAGYYLTVKVLVADQIAKMKAKMHSMTAEKKGGGAPPANPPA